MFKDKDLSLYLIPIKFQDLMFFTKHLAIMTKSGISLTESLNALAEQSSSIQLKKVIKHLLSEIEDGKTLHQAMSEYPMVFGPLYLNLIRVGEESGNLEDNLEQLAKRLRKDYEFKQKVKTASLYPSIVLITTIAIGMGVSIFILPQLTTLFTSLGTDLPASTRILIFIANTMQSYGAYIFTSLFVLYILLASLIKISPFKLYWQILLMNIPVVNKFIQNTQMALFCYNTSLMISSGITITQAIKEQIASADNLVFKGYFEEITNGLESGKSIAEKLEESHFTYFPSISEKMIAVGEKTGKLDESFLYLGEFFEEEVDNITKNLSTIIEPLLLAVIGMIVFFVAIAFITPIYQFTSSVGR